MRSPLSIIELPKSTQDAELPTQAARLLMSELGSDRYKSDEADQAMERRIAYLDETIALAALGERAMLGAGTLKLIESGQGIIGRIMQLAVIEGHRGDGVGRRIVSALEERAREEGAHSMRLQTLYDVRPFYEKLGYQTAGDTFVFTKQL